MGVRKETKTRTKNIHLKCFSFTAPILPFSFTDSIDNDVKWDVSKGKIDEFSVNNTHTYLNQIALEWIEKKNSPGIQRFVTMLRHTAFVIVLATYWINFRDRLAYTTILMR